MDIKGVEGNPLYSLSRANKQRVSCAVLYFHGKEDFSYQDVQSKFFGLGEWLRKTYKKEIPVNIQNVLCVVRNNDNTYEIHEIIKPAE